MLVGSVTERASVVGAPRGVRDALAALDAAFENPDLESVRELCTDDVLFIGSRDGEEAVDHGSEPGRW